MISAFLWGHFSTTYKPCLPDLFIIEFFSQKLYTRRKILTTWKINIIFVHTTNPLGLTRKEPIQRNTDNTCDGIFLFFKFSFISKIVLLLILDEYFHPCFYLLSLSFKIGNTKSIPNTFLNNLRHNTEYAEYA